MKTLFISRKTSTSFGGLARFSLELARNTKDSYLLTPSTVGMWARLPFWKLDHIHLCDATLLPLGMILKRFLKKPITVTAHGLDITYKNRLYQNMIRKLLPKMDGVILDSFAVMPLVSHFSLKHLSVIYPGITLEHLKYPKNIDLPINKNNIVLTSVGNLVERKGHEWFIRSVMPRLPKRYHYFIVGAGPQKNNIQKSINAFRLEKRVHLLGQLSNSELSFVLRSTTVYVSPNQQVSGNFESFGIAAVEAAAMGIPVVASKVDGIPEAIVHNKNGIVIEPTAQSFISELKKLQKTSLKKTIGLMAKTYTLTNYSWISTAKKYSELFRAVSYKNQLFPSRIPSN